MQIKTANAFEIDYGSVASAYTATEDYGSIASAATVDLDYGLISDPISGTLSEFSSSNVYGTVRTLTGMQELQKYQIKVRVSQEQAPPVPLSVVRSNCKAIRLLPAFRPASPPRVASSRLN